MALVTLKSELTIKDNRKRTDSVDINSSALESIFKLHDKNDTHIAGHLNLLGTVGNEDNPQTFTVRNVQITGKKEFEQKTNTDNLQKYYNRAFKDSDPLGYRNPTFNHTDLLSGGQPFIIREIGQTWSGGNVSGIIDQISDGFVRGGMITAASRTVADVERVGKFLLSGNGIVFLAKQSILQLFNARNETKIYNPLSVPVSLVPTVRERRHASLFGAIGSDGRYIKTKSVLDLKKIRSMGDASAPNYTGIDIPNFKESIIEIGNNIFKKATGAVGLGNKYVTDLTDKVNLIPYGSGRDGSAPTVQGNPVEKLDLIPFKIKDLTNNKWLIFRAILSGITDNVTAEWNEYKYIGRPDKMYNYQGATRTVSFTLELYPKTRQELPVLWDKLNFLVGLCYPHWTDDAGNLRMTGPFVELSLIFLPIRLEL